MKCRDSSPDSCESRKRGDLKPQTSNLKTLNNYAKERNLEVRDSDSDFNPVGHRYGTGSDQLHVIAEARNVTFVTYTHIHIYVHSFNFSRGRQTTRTVFLIVAQLFMKSTQFIEVCSSLIFLQRTTGRKDFFNPTGRKKSFFLLSLNRNFVSLQP